MRLLTTTEAAEYLRLKERKIYELVSEGAIPCTKITGKWLFPKDELDRWLADSLQRPAGMSRQEPMPIIGGSHDPLLEWALRESGSGLATLPEGSEAGLARFMRGELMAAAIHLHALASETADANVEAMRSERSLYDAVLIAFARREQGFLIAAGNPLGIVRLDDVLEKRARVAVRPQGAGAQLLLQALLHRAKTSLDRLKVVEPALPDRPRRRAGDPRRPRRLRDRHPFGRQRRRPRLRADPVGALRPRRPPARLFPQTHAGAARVPAFSRHGGPREGTRRVLPGRCRQGPLHLVRGRKGPRDAFGMPSARLPQASLKLDRALSRSYKHDGLRVIAAHTFIREPRPSQ